MVERAPKSVTFKLCFTSRLENHFVCMCVCMTLMGAFFDLLRGLSFSSDFSKIDDPQYLRTTA